MSLIGNISHSHMQMYGSADIVMIYEKPENDDQTLSWSLLFLDSEKPRNERSQSASSQQLHLINHH